jgi:hypothetical protein
MDVREKIFVIFGADFPSHRQIIENIKKRILIAKTKSLDTLTFYSREIDIEDLKEKIFTASFSQSRIIIFKDFCDLPSAVRDFLFTNLSKILHTNYVIFETDKDSAQLRKNRALASDKLFSLILNKASLFRTNPAGKEVSIEDFIFSTRREDLVSSLYVLEKLFEKGSKDEVLGPQIIGILVQKFSRLKNSSDKDRCFKHLWEADRAIKEKGLSSRVILEALLVKLFNKF